MSALFRRSYNDQDIVSRAESALSDDPLINAARIGVSSQRGVVTLSGIATSSEKDKAVETVRNSLDQAGLDYREILDEIRT